MTDSWHIPDPIRQPEFYSDTPIKRAIAWVVDFGIVLAMCLLLLLFTAFTAIFILPFLVAMVGFAYRVVTLSRGSATWGMRLVAIELRTVRGEKFDLGMALAHTTGIAITLVIPILTIVTIVMMLTSSHGQGLTDRFLGTVALNRRAGG